MLKSLAGSFSIGFCMHMVMQKVMFAWLLCIAGHAQAATITFDLRNLGPAIDREYSVLVDGLELGFAQSNSGQIVSTAWGIGIDSGYIGEAAGFINGNVQSVAKAESMFFFFSKDVVIESITLVWSTPGVVPVIDPKGVVSQTTVLGNGTSQLPDLIVGRTSANRIYHSAAGFFPANGGFAIQSITVVTVPEPGMALPGLFGTVLLFARRRIRP